MAGVSMHDLMRQVAVRGVVGVVASAAVSWSLGCTPTLAPTDDGAEADTAEDSAVSSGEDATLATTGTGDPVSTTAIADSTGATEEPVYSAVGLLELDGAYKLIRVRKLAPSRAYCVELELRYPDAAEPPFEDVAVWSDWSVSRAWVRTPVVDCQEPFDEPGIVREFATHGSGTIVPRDDEVFPCILESVDIEVELPASSDWSAFEHLDVDALPVDAPWCP